MYIYKYGYTYDRISKILEVCNGLINGVITISVRVCCMGFVMRKARKREESESHSATGWFCMVREIRVCGSVATCYCSLGADDALRWTVGCGLWAACTH